jgi:hypothetical protein
VSDGDGAATVDECDLCGEADPQWVIPCHAFQVDTARAKGFAGPSAPDYWACDGCARCWRRGEWLALLRRAAKGLNGRMEGTPSEQRRAELIRWLRPLHRQIRRNQAGPPRRLEPADLEAGQQDT